MGMADLVDSFLETLSSDHTRRGYCRDLSRFFGEGTVQTKEVQAVSSEAIKVLVQSMHRDELSRSTQRRTLAALRRFFDWLIERGVLKYNPARAPEIEPIPPDSGSTNSSVLTREEVEHLVATAGENSQTGLRDQTLILTIVYAALRRSEVAALTVENIRPLGRHWIIDLETSGTTKGGYVRIPDFLVELIERMKEAYGISGGPLWRSCSNRNRGSRMSPDAIYKVIRRMAERAGLGSVTIDGLRQTGLRLALDGGADLLQIQAHGRFSASSSAVRLHDTGKRFGTLDDSAVEYVELDLSGLPLNT